MKFCVKCGKGLSATASFCVKCGNPVRNRTVTSFGGGIGPGLPQSQNHRNNITAIIIAAVVVGSLMAVSLYIWFNRTNDMPGIHVFHAVYHDHVVVVEGARYSFTFDGDVVTITLYAPCDEARRIAQGDIFVLEPTSQNIEGFAGHVIGVSEQGANLVIRARLPDSLDEIFYEFELLMDIDLLEFADASVLDESLVGLPGVELIGNPTMYRGIRLNRSISGIEFDGEIRLYSPRIQVSIRSRFGVPIGVDELTLHTRVALDIDVVASGDTERIIPLFTIPLSKFGTGIDVPVGIRVSASGEFAIYLDAGVDAQFGVRNNNFVAHVTPWYRLEYRFNARVAVSANIQARARILWGNVYGIQGDFGKGLQTNNAMQARCPQNVCFVAETFHVRRIASLTDWGLLRNVQAIRFNVDLAQNLPVSTWFLSGGTVLRTCPHTAATVATPQPVVPTPTPAGAVNVSIGEIIPFGNHNWRVLDVQGDRALIITENIISVRMYHNEFLAVTWETSEMRQYLNSIFLNSFSETDRARILETTLINNNNQWSGINGGNDTTDRIFLLCIEEVVQYFGNSGQLQNRPSQRLFWISDYYNNVRIARDAAGSATWWWLRSPGDLPYSAAGVTFDGSLSMYGNIVFWSGGVGGGVRPALWLNLTP